MNAQRSKDQAVIIIGLFALLCSCQLFIVTTHFNHVDKPTSTLNRSAIPSTELIMAQGDKGRVVITREGTIDTPESANQEPVVVSAHVAPQETSSTPQLPPVAPPEEPIVYPSVEEFLVSGSIQWNGSIVIAHQELTTLDHGITSMGRPVIYRADGIGTMDGLIAVLMPTSVPWGTVVDTPFGPGICVGHGDASMRILVG